MEVTEQAAHKNQKVRVQQARTEGKARPYFPY